MRMMIDDTSVCLVNCHLAAGQTQTMNRNKDINDILESAMLPAGGGFSHGGDGTMILDHDI